jgi:hypothetical protein
VLIPGAEQPSGENLCAVACRCPCSNGHECDCAEGLCPVDICLTGSDHERARVPGDCLRRKRIPCTVEATAR